ncbi:MAG: NUDIX hydrolase [Alphaproteobacteria bacterium 16-39-46]|nr:MAG: NUDIX hydrolase [Alphaproteobacteria bacterium 16-39-46]OZA41796.1 MAG: NUDIX hydrolase [Alphaproteobacteria bacterium 17-39-52]HQS84698.1 NUDIX domain-containing protein [Alphaproteobacteria bacterium]HQS94519.1 NUDIX domain-containing protein [Alphaproteobacteria bacterium]
MNNAIKDLILKTISEIVPFDSLEQEHILETKSWIESGAPIFRIKKPDVPNKHLVSYFVLFDEKASKILLVDHKKAQLWLPTGGHVELDEDPKEAVRRECFEELRTQAQFWCEEPLFLTSTKTVGLTSGHWDVSLWYVLKGDSQAEYLFDRDEFEEIRWFNLKDIPAASDPHMKRFIEKLEENL